MYPDVHSSPYPPVNAQENTSNLYFQGYPYNQVTEPVPPYYMQQSQAYPPLPSGNSRFHEDGGLRGQFGVPPHLQQTGGSPHGSFHIGSQSAPAQDFRSNSLGYDAYPRLSPASSFVENEQVMPRPQVPFQSQRFHGSQPPYSNDPGPTGGMLPTKSDSQRMAVSSRRSGFSSMRCLLHGTLDVVLYAAVNLPNMDIFSEKIRQATSSLPSILQRAKSKAKEAAANVTGITSDPYVIVVLAGARVARTRVISNNVNPKWDEHFSVPVAHYVYEVVFTIKDQDVLGSQHIGDVKIPVEQLLDGDIIDDWFEVLNTNGKLCHAGAKLHLRVSYQPVEKVPLYTQGVGPDSFGVPFTYFPLRKGCDLTLYQDTHIYDSTLPRIWLESGVEYHQHRCWEEMCAAIAGARHLVYLAGWSIYDKIKLVRDINRPVPDCGNLTLGELLKKKSADGIRVLLLQWDDRTSNDYSLLKTNGVMNTHDEETKKFFKNTGVRCILAPRYADDKVSWVRQKVVGTLYSHHQKVVIVDTDGPSDRRKLTSFIGGLDLTGGRWDTPSHLLFSSLQNEHKGDFRNKSFTDGAEGGGPREPWHDWHCRIDGHAAYDVLTNFEQRWRKATHRHDDELLDINRIPRILSPSNQAPPDGDPTLNVTKDNDPETWHVQVFRSIDSGSVKGFPKIAEEVQQQHLVWGKSVAIDVSIQMAYIKAIRSAQHFIYIENQYFLGSSYNWPDYDKAGANHLIPMELALKICSKIRAGQMFAVYVVVPMWPEGVPESAPVQEILYFQSQTMKMMYKLIAEALRDCGLTGQRHPRDYLNFYCLGNREVKKSFEPEPLRKPEPNSKHWHAQKNRRFMIYVHAKGMIVDDEFVIVGSANINQRSMDGSRDTEIAMGAYQPYHTWSFKHAPPRGQVYGYRMSLWAEHFGTLEPTFEDPESAECVCRVNALAESNWQQYTASEVTDMQGHLMPYPLQVTVDGLVMPLPGHEKFPDVGGSVMGTNQPNLPDDLTA